MPDHLKSVDINRIIPANKDVDCFNPINQGYLLSNNNGICPCTPRGIINLIKSFGLELEGQNVCIIGRSNIVGKPLSLMMTNENATVTLCHSKTKNIKEITKQADIIVVAIGKAEFLDETFLSKNKKPIVIDVGINQVENKVVGDVNFKNVCDLTKAITPVPEAGPMTVVTLMENLLQATKEQEKMRTKLYDKHLSLNAKMVDFAGWEMPIQYQNLKEEVLARNKSGVFDVSHMGEFLLPVRTLKTI